MRKKHFPFLDNDVPRSTAYVYKFLNLFLLLECLVMSMTLILVIKFDSKTSQQGYIYHQLRKALSKFYRRHFDISVYV